jgi:hypothetical protein
VLRLDVARVRLEEQGRDGKQGVVGGVDARCVGEAGGFHLLKFDILCGWYVDFRSAHTVRCGSVASVI